MIDIKKDNCGQISAEYIMIAGFMIIVSCSVAIFISSDSELTHAMASARTGATQGIITDSLAIYPDESFKNYEKDHLRLISPSGVKIVQIKYKNEGYQPLYNRTKIQLQIYAKAIGMSSSDLNCLGDRINYHARRSICITFNTQDLTNSFFNPAFSNRYFFTTADVKWV
ncbi:MAG: hypothetical protein LUQ24_08275 [Methanobacterium sp.]|nr:hypothetical protein [Methanobacterium sp.]